MDDGIEHDLREIEQDLRESRENEPGHVSTFSLCMYLLTVLAWEVEIGVVLVHAFAKKKLDPLGHAVLLVFWGTLTLVTWFRGKQDFQRLAHTRGRIPITGVQCVVITIFVVSFGLVLTFIFVRFIEN